MNQQWPLWATLRSEEVAQLPEHQQGPWRNGRPCQVHRGGKHPTEHPYFFHCANHLKKLKAQTRQVQPWAPRDRGECVSCGKPAERLPVKQNYKKACMQAERSNQTVARMYTKGYCTQCATKRSQPCRGTHCRDTDNNYKVQPADCCPTTHTGHRRHCARCCIIGQNRRLQRKGANTQQQLTNKRLAAKLRKDNRLKMAALRRLGIDNKEIAEILQVAPETVATELAHLHALTRNARQTNQQQGQERHDTIAELHRQGLHPPAIADQVGITKQIVEKHLAELRSRQEGS